MKKTISDKIKKLFLSSHFIAHKMITGMFRSRFIGEGLDFHSIREYSLQDDGRLIDWNVTAKLNSPFVKTYKKTLNTNFFLCVDFSYSMSSSYNNIMLQDTAKEIIFIFSLLALNMFIPIGLIYFTSRSSNLFVPSTSKNAIFRMLKKIDEIDITDNGGSPLVDALKKTSIVLHSRSIVFVLSDFNIKDYKKALIKLASRHDVVCVKLINNNNFSLPHVGSIVFSDYEQDFSSMFNTASKSFIKKYNEKYKSELREWKDICLASHAYPLLINSSDNLIKVLASFFATYNNNIR